MWFKRTPSPPSPAFEIGAAPLERLRRWFEQEDISIAPATADQIADLERRCDVALPDSFRTYLSTLAPAEENWDAEMGNWWPIERIRTVPQEVDWGEAAHAQYLVFADYSIWCWAWAIACTDDANRGRIIVLGAGEKFVADSFDAFVDKYLTDNISVC